MAGNIKKAVVFVVMTFLLNWTMAFSFFALGGRSNTLAWYVMAVTYMFVPMTVAILVQKLVYREPVAKPLCISFRLNRWFLVAWLLPVAIAAAIIGVSVLLPGVEFTTDATASRMFGYLESVLPPQALEQAKNRTDAMSLHPFWIGLVSALMAGITINAVAGFGEELGWRGFLQKQLIPIGFWKSSVLIGLIWGVWHAPLILHGHNYPDHPVAGVFMMTIFCMLLGPIFSYVTIRAKSVIAAAIIHGSLNATGGLPLSIIKGGDDLTVGFTGLAGFIVLGVVNLVLFTYDLRFAKQPVMAGCG